MDHKSNSFLETEKIGVLLPLAFGLDGVLYSFPAADLLTFVVAVFVIARTYKELGAKTE